MEENQLVCEVCGKPAVSVVRDHKVSGYEEEVGKYYTIRWPVLECTSQHLFCEEHDRLAYREPRDFSAEVNENLLLTHLNDPHINKLVMDRIFNRSPYKPADHE